MSARFLSASFRFDLSFSVIQVFLFKVPDSHHLSRNYRNFSVKFQQMYSLFHGVLFLTIIFNLAWNV